PNHKAGAGNGGREDSRDLVRSPPLRPRPSFLALLGGPASQIARVVVVVRPHLATEVRAPQDPPPRWRPPVRGAVILLCSASNYSPDAVSWAMDQPGFTTSLVVACLIRVPSEVVKQRAQVSASSRTFQIFSNILYEEGIQGLYRGYKSTVLREIPFSLVQFPLWESLKAQEPPVRRSRVW
uniref:Mitochondrial S-adenosylmethionine carrier protein n=2 Tax=Equus TaxID=9789 RepID=A0A9L0SP96_HORSE